MNTEIAVCIGAAIGATSVVVHELAHAAACMLYGGQAAIYWILPVEVATARLGWLGHLGIPGCYCTVEYLNPLLHEIAAYAIQAAFVAACFFCFRKKLFEAD